MRSLQEPEACGDDGVAEAGPSLSADPYVAPGEDAMARVREWTPPVEWPAQQRLACPAPVLPAALAGGFVVALLLLLAACAPPPPY